MIPFLCPVCKGELHENDRSLVCKEGHRFDLSKKGYVNLLCGSSAGRHGDDKQMVNARTGFLGAGYYIPLRDRVTALALSHAKKDMTVLDAGCGEGYYTSHLKNALYASGHPAAVYGIDVSKDAINAAARDRELHLAVASIFDIPLPNETADLILNLFAPFDHASFGRVMKKGGILLRAFPAERHLYSMKEIVYDEPYENEIDTFALEGFTLLEKELLTFPLDIRDPSHIDALFKMTPYYYKTCREGQARLAALPRLQTEASFYLTTYQKTPLVTCNL